MDKAQQETIAYLVNEAEGAVSMESKQAFGYLASAVAELADLHQVETGAGTNGDTVWKPRETQEHFVAHDGFGGLEVREAKQALAELERARGPVTSAADSLASSVDAYGEPCTFCKAPCAGKFLADGEKFCSATCVTAYRQREDRRATLDEFPINVERQPNNTFRVLVGAEFGTLDEADAFSEQLAMRIGDSDAG